MKNRVLSGLLATTMLFSMLPTTVFATGEITTSGGTNDVPAKVTQDATTFSVTVPTSLPVHVDSDGEVTVATDNKIINNSYGPVEVKSIEVQPKNDWSLVDFTTDFSSKKVGLKEFGFQVNDAAVLTDGSCDVEFNIIPGNSQLGFTYDAVVAMQKAALSDEQIASVVFTVGWADSAAEDTGPSGYEITPVSELDTYEDESGNVSLVLDNGESADLSAIATYSMEAPTWTSSNTDVLTVSEDGVITAKRTGYAEITYGTSRVSETIGVWVPRNLSITSSNRSLVGYTGEENEELIIPEYVMDSEQLKKVTSIGSQAFAGCTGLTSITIPNSVTSIGSQAFAGCTGLTSITIPNSVTKIGSSAFEGCTSLTSITIPDSVTSISNSAFRDCTSLTSVTIPDSVTSIGDYAFSGCTNLTSITVDENNTIYDSRNNCNAIIETATNTLLVGTVTTVIPYSVTSIGNNAFYNCKALTGITIPNSVTSISQGAFYGCTSLTSITIPNSVTSISQGVFYGCTSLTSITISNSVTSIGYQAFNNCTSLTTVNYTGTQEQWNEITINSGNAPLTSATINYNYITPGLYNANGERLVSWVDSGIDVEKDYTYSNYKTEPTSGYSVLSSYPEVTKVVIPDSVTSIGNNAFDGCSGLTSIEIPDDVTSIGYGAFRDCIGLTSIDLPNSLTSIGDDAFHDCKSLTSIVIPDSVTSIDASAFQGTGLTSIVIPDSVTSIDNSAFGDCSDLTIIAVDSNNSVYDSRNNCNAIIETASNTLIAGCQTTVIPNSVTSIGTGAFGGSDLTSIVIPDGVETIGDGAFYNCCDLTSVVLGDGVTSIGVSAFEKCTRLTTINYRGSESDWNSINLDYGWDNRAGFDVGGYTVVYNYQG